MNCKQFQAFLDPYPENILSPVDLPEVERHAATCAGCREQMTQQEQLSRMARQLPRVAAPAGFEQELMRRIRAQEYKKFRYRWFNMPRPAIQSLVYASLLVAMGISVVLLQHKSTGEPTGLVGVAPRNESSDIRPAPAVPVEERIGGDWIPTADSRFNAGLRRSAIRRASWGEYSIPADTEYVDYLLKGTGNKEVFVRIPRTILYHAPADADPYYIRNISH